EQRRELLRREGKELGVLSIKGMDEKQVQEIVKQIQEATTEREFFGNASKKLGARQLYRRLDATQEWAEDNYHHLPVQQHTADLVPVNAFWLDYARHDGKG